jgi:DNA-binding transcriptional regulator GbsR (MarR family)
MPAQTDLEKLALKVGSFMEYWGFKKVHGQIWTHLFLSRTPLDATTLGKRLGVSKGLVSLAVKDLLQYQVIQKSSKGLKRTVYLVANPQVYKVICGVLMQRERKILEEVLGQVRELREHPGPGSEMVSPERLEELESMTETAKDFVDLLIASELDFAATGPEEKK